MADEKRGPSKREYGSGPNLSRWPHGEGGKVTAGVPLAKIIKPRLVGAAELVVRNRPRSQASERFRQLGKWLGASGPDARTTVVVTSAVDGEGKSLVAMNLSLALAAPGDGEAVLVDANLRRPTVAGWMRPSPEIGLSELLSDRTDLTHVLFELDGCPLRVLPAGRPPRDPLELLVSDGFERLVTALKQRFRYVVIDTPPIVPFTDADLVGRWSDGVLIVARAGVTRRGPLAQAISSVTSAPILGTLLNDVVR